MRYSTLGRTGLFVSELWFGAMTFGGKGGIWEKIGKTAQQEADRLIGLAFDSGINFFDTADVYSEGESERILGNALGSRRKDIALASKVRLRTGPGPNDVGLSRAHIMASVDESLRRLGTDWIDLYQIHGYDALTPLDETLRAQKHVTTIIIGARNEQQLRDNIGATALELTPEDLGALEKVSALLPEYPGWMITRQA